MGQIRLPLGPNKMRFSYGFFACLLFTGSMVVGDETQNVKTDIKQPAIVPPTALGELHSAVVLAIENRKYDDAVKDYVRLLELDPQLRGGFTGLQHGTATVLKAPPDVGRQEVEKLFADLQLGTAITTDDAIYKWLVSCFSGRDSCNRIVWNKLDPEGGFSAVHRSPSKEWPAELRIRKRRTRLTLLGIPIETVASHDELWFSLVFEVHNSHNYRRFSELRELARYGILARDSFIA